MATEAAEFGSLYRLSGTTAGRRDGSVEVDGAWNSGPWQLLDTGVVNGGAYDVDLPTTEHGSLEVRVKYPGGEADGTVLVP